VAQLAERTKRHKAPEHHGQQHDVAKPSRLPISPLAMRSAQVQPKLTVNTPGDRYEQEADRIADQVMRMPDRPSSNHRLSFSSVDASTAQRKCTACEEGEKLQRKEDGSTAGKPATVPPVVHEVLRSPGQPLDPVTRAFMEPRFGQNFSRVRVHADGDAAKSATSIKARAFTLGQDIFFRQGEYRPSNRVGQELLAHELTHVVQQKNARQSEQIQRAPEEGSDKLSIAGTPDNAIEMWKDVIADRHHQQKGLEGEMPFRRLKIQHKEGPIVDITLTESDKVIHAEEKAIGIARKQIGEGQKIEGGKIIFVTDQIVCDKPGRCRYQIIKFAKELGVEEVEATLIRRLPLPDEKPKDGLALPKAVAKKVQRRVVEGFELITSTETIYKRPKPQSAMPKPQSAMPKPEPAMPKPQSAMPKPQPAMPKLQPLIDAHQGGVPKLDLNGIGKATIRSGLLLVAMWLLGSFATRYTERLLRDQINRLEPDIRKRIESEATRVLSTGWARFNPRTPMRVYVRLEISRMGAYEGELHDYFWSLPTVSVASVQVLPQAIEQAFPETYGVGESGPFFDRVGLGVLDERHYYTYAIPLESLISP